MDRSVLRMKYWCFAFCFYALTMISFGTGTKVQQCSYVGKRTFNKCGTLEKEKLSFKTSKLNRLYKNDTTPKGCVFNPPCRRVFKVGRLRRQTFGAKTLVQISEMLHRCCGDCTKYKRINIDRPLHDLNDTELDEYDVIYPVPAQKQTNELYDRYFIPVYNVPPAYYFTLKKSNKDMAINIVQGCTKMWPLLAVCILMSLIAGFFGWIMETWSNPDEFPRPFLNGLMEGFWWAFISMTTIGYGDKSPKSVHTRLFSIIWILIGITHTSIYIASLTTEIMIFQEPVKPRMTGVNVGVLKDHLHDASIVSQHGGTLKEIEFNNTVYGVLELIKKLRDREIGGFILNKETYFYFSRVVKDLARYKDRAASVSHINLLLTEKTMLHDPLVTGIVLKSKADYVYFQKFFQSNWHEIQGCYNFDLNFKEKKFVEEYVNAVSGLLVPFLGGSLTILGLILCFGLPYEIRRRRVKNIQGSDNSFEEHEVKALATS